MNGKNRKNQPVKVPFIRITVVFLLACAITQLWGNFPIGSVISLFTDSEERSRYLSVRLFFAVCLVIYLCCAAVLIMRRAQSQKTVFNLPYRGEILLHVGSVVLLLISGIPLGPSFNGIEDLLRTLEYWCYLGSGAIVVSWLSFVGVVFFGPEKQREDLDVYLRGVTGMKLED